MQGNSLLQLKYGSLTFTDTYKLLNKSVESAG